MSGSTSRAPLEGGGPTLSSSRRPAAADNTDPDRHHTSSSHSSHAKGSSSRSQPSNGLGGKKPIHPSASASSLAVHSPSCQSDAEVGEGKEGAGGSPTVQPRSSTTPSARGSSRRSNRSTHSNHAASTSPATKVAKVGSPSRSRAPPSSSSSSSSHFRPNRKATFSSLLGKKGMKGMKGMPAPSTQDKARTINMGSPSPPAKSKLVGTYSPDNAIGPASSDRPLVSGPGHVTKKTKKATRADTEGVSPVVNVEIEVPPKRTHRLGGSHSF